MARTRVPGRAGKVQDAPREETYRRCAEAIQRATWGDAPAIALEVGASPRTVQAWGEPQRREDEPYRRNPAYDLLLLMRAALRLKGDPEKALAPLIVLAEDLGYDLVEKPGSSLGSLEREFAEVVSSIGDLAGEHADIAADGQIDTEEYFRQMQRLRQVRRELEEYEASLQASLREPR